MEKKFITPKVTIKETLLGIPIGGSIMLSTKETSKESIRVMCSFLKKELGAVYTVTTHDNSSYSVKRVE